MKRCFYAIADSNNLEYYEKMKNSLEKFHPDEELILFSEKEIKATGDSEIFYRSAPTFGLQLMDRGYEHVIKIDVDQIITGDLSYILDQKYDVGTVLNFNRIDPPKYGEVAGWGITAQEYYNAGLVAVQSREFMQHWYDICYSKHFPRFQFREQDILNILCHYGKYKVNCFDMPDIINKYVAWHGLISKGEWLKLKLEDGKLFLPKGPDNYPPIKTEIKLLHWAGGKDEKKMHYKTLTTEPIIKHLDKLVRKNGKK